MNPSGQRTIFIVLEDGTAIRNILRTDVFSVLKAQKDLRIVIFTPLADEEFKKEMQAENVLVEMKPAYKNGPVVSMLESIRKEIWAHKTGIYTFAQKRIRKPAHRFRMFLVKHLLRANTPERLEKLLALLERWKLAATPLLAGEFFDRYKPDLVFYATLYTKSHYIERGAQQRGIRTVAFVLSWDNPTSKGPFPVTPDRVIVWNDLLKQELIQYHNYQPEQLYVSGVPQFDIYTQHEKFLSRAAFFEKWKLDPAKKLITYTTGTPGTSPFDHEVIDLLYQSMQQGALRQPSQLLVRLHPKDRLSDYDRFKDKPDLIIQLPGRRASTGDSWNPTHEDMFGLAELMYYTDVNVNVASTITIDAAAFDTPVVNIAYDGYTTKPYPESCLRYLDYEHYRVIVKTGGVKIAYSNEETVKHIQSYLDDKTQEAEGRRIIREQQCWKLDGQSSRRIGEYILSQLPGKK